jgi:hypothetical protein
MERRWQVTDRCEYTQNRQIISYNIAAVGDERLSYDIRVSYALQTADDLIDSLKQVGFSSTVQFRFEFWPYIVIVAEKAKNNNET